jgi:predicted secreted Zn-dependent protease
MLEEMDARGPHDDEGHWAGRTSWSLEWSYRMVSADGHEQCSMGPVSVRLDLSTLLPRWRPAAPATEWVQDRWRESITRLAKHEAGHRSLAEHAARRIHDELDDLGMFTTCAELSRHAETIAIGIRAELRADQAEYDRVTRHGSAQDLFP